MTESGSFRVLPGPTPDSRRFLDVAAVEPVTVPVADQPTPVGELPVGYVIDAALDWSRPEPIVTDLAVSRATLFSFVDGADPVFEVARDTWTAAREAGEAMNGRVTRNTDGAVNGAVYTFAESGPGSRFAEFERGARPLEPLLERFDEAAAPGARSVFVLRPEPAEFVAVTIAGEKGGQFDRTLRETYECPPPAEPLA